MSLIDFIVFAFLLFLIYNLVRVIKYFVLQLNFNEYKFFNFDDLFSLPILVLTLSLSFGAFPVVKSIFGESWVNTPMLENVLEQRHIDLEKLSVKSIVIAKRDTPLKNHNGSYNGFKVKTNKSKDFYSGLYLLKGMKAKYKDGRWFVTVPESVLTHDPLRAKAQLNKLLDTMIDKNHNPDGSHSSWN